MCFYWKIKKKKNVCSKMWPIYHLQFGLHEWAQNLLKLFFFLPMCWHDLATKKRKEAQKKIPNTHCLKNKISFVGLHYVNSECSVPRTACHDIHVTLVECQFLFMYCTFLTCAAICQTHEANLIWLLYYCR